MPDPLASTRSSPDRLAASLGIAAIILLIALFSRWTGKGNDPITYDAFATLLVSLPLTLLWLATAIGFGWQLQRWLAREATNPIALQIGLGIGAMLIGNAALGAIGLLTIRLVAALIILAGLSLLALQIAPAMHRSREIRLPHWIFWFATPAIVVLLIAACSAPGWLWASEFGGYDALSYHLQLPKEWLALGCIQPVEHNVYSFLPGYVEAAYLHLMSLRGSAHAMQALIDCQMLHALLTIITAAIIGVLASRWGGKVIGAVAAALCLVTPWTIIVGSLGYNEMAVNLMLATGLLIVSDDRIAPVRRGVLIGVIAAAACGAKLTSIGFVAAPLGLLLLMRLPIRQWLPAMIAAALAGFVCLLPYYLRNALHAGNPVFPFATSLLGSAHWNAEQIQIWHRGHLSDSPVVERFRTLWQQFFTYGLGSNPDPHEPWKPQWGLLPWLGMIGGAMAVLRPSLRRITIEMLLVLLVQIAFWLAFTHLQSRFLLPTAVPLCVLTALGLSSIVVDRSTLSVSRSATSATAVALLALSLLPVWIFRGEGNGAPALAIGAVASFTGDALTDAERRDVESAPLPAIAINHLLPEGSRVLLVGESAPLYMRLDRITYTTVWDRGPLSQVMREQSNDPEAWREALRQTGLTHMLVNPTMLDIWQRPPNDWNDPLLTRATVIDFAERACEPLYDYPRDVTLYALPE